MAYPLSTYSYSFVRRMRELALPIEAYHLQIADIDETLNLKPAMFDLLIGNVTVLSNGDLTYKDEYKYLITEHTLIRPCEIFIIGNGSTDHAYDLLQKALLRCIVGLTVYAYYFYFDKVIVDKECVDLIKSLCTRKGQLLKFENCTISEDVTINMMAGLDLYLKNCNIQKCFFTDIEEFLNKKDSKQILFIDHDENELLEMFDYNIVNVFGFKKLEKVWMNTKLLVCNGNTPSRSVLYQVLLKNTELPAHHDDLLKLRLHGGWFSKLRNFTRFYWCHFDYWAAVRCHIFDPRVTY